MEKSVGAMSYSVIIFDIYLQQRINIYLTGRVAALRRIAFIYYIER
jgi:hypothetical protein